MFKKYIVSICILAASGFVPAHAADKTKPVLASSSSSDFFFKPYIGADYQYSVYGNEDIGGGAKTDDIIDRGLHGFGVHVGARVHQYLGVELGYSQTQKGTKDASGWTYLGTPLSKTKTDVKSGALDVFGYLPVAQSFELIGTVGVSYAEATVSDPALGSEKEREWKPRVGAGAQYWLSDNVNARGLVRYQGADFGDTVNNAVVTSVGLNYQF